MGWIGDIVDAAKDVVNAVVEIIVQIVEVVIEFIMQILGYEDEQTIEYFEVHNIPLFDNVDEENPLTNIIIRSIIKQEDIASNLIYGSVFRTLKGDLRDFMQFIDDGNYFESFPQIDSYITYPDYTELVAVLDTIEGEACTSELAYVQPLSNKQWIQSYFQNNIIYDVGTNVLGTSITKTTSTTPASTSDDSDLTYTDYQISVDSEAATSDDASIELNTVEQENPTTSPASTSHDNALAQNFFVDADSEAATEDDVTATLLHTVDFADITYNSGPDNYSVGVYTAGGTYGYLTVPSKPTALHYISYYYKNSAPSDQLIFIYKVGEGTYPTLDDPQNEINIDNNPLETVPAIPLRIANVDYTTLAQTKIDQINDLCELVSLDAEAVLDSILNDPDAVAGDIDNIYINFGIRLRDTSQIGLAYLFNMFQNLFPAQGVTEGDYNGAAAGEDKPVNNIIIQTEDYKYLFQFNYITFTSTTLAWIDANTGSTENAVYYSDLSKFNDSNILVFPYYSSTAKPTYNVGYKADDLAEVALFLAGSGVVNPGTVDPEATNWLQVTTRIPYNNPTPVLQDDNGSTSALIYLTPDMVYVNASGTLRHVQAASESTTSGQSVTYYKIKPEGLDAYKVHAPIGSWKVVDGDTGKFKLVKLNLGDEKNLMVPFIHNFIKDLSQSQVSQLFLAGTHATIYIAHYEVIEQSGFGGLFMIILIVIIAVIAWQVAPQMFGALQGTATAGTAVGGTATVGGTVLPASVTAAGGVTTATVGGIAVPTGTFISTTAPLTGIVSTGIAGAGGVVSLSVAWGTSLFNIAVNFAVNQLVKMAITAVAEDNPELGMILGIVAAIGMNSLNISGGNVSFEMPDFKDIFKIFSGAATNISRVSNIYTEDALEGLREERRELIEDYDAIMTELRDIQRELFRRPDGNALSWLDTAWRINHNPILAANYNAINDNLISVQYVMYDSQFERELIPTFT